MKRAFVVLAIMVLALSSLSPRNVDGWESGRVAEAAETRMPQRNRSGPHTAPGNGFFSIQLLGVVDRIIITSAPGIQWLRIAAHTGFGGNKPETWRNVFFDDIPFTVTPPVTIVAPKSLPPCEGCDWQVVRGFTGYAWGPGPIEYYVEELTGGPPYAVEGGYLKEGEPSITFSPQSAQAGNTVTITITIPPYQREHIGRVDLSLPVEYDTWTTVSLPGDPSGVYSFQWTVPPGYYGRDNWHGGSAGPKYVAYANKPDPSGQFYEVTRGAGFIEVPSLLKVRMGMQGRFVDELSSAVWRPDRPKEVFATATGGKQPLTFTWRLDGEVFTERPPGMGSKISQSPALERAQTISVTVTDANGNQAGASFKLGVSAAAARIQECRDLIAQAQQLISAQNLSRASQVLTQLRQKCAGVDSQVTRLLRDTERQLQQAISALVNSITANMQKCDYVAALQIAEQVRQIDPGNRWVAHNLALLRSQAAAQSQARIIMRLARNSLQSNNVEGAVTLMRNALALHDLPVCMRDPINALLKEAEHRKLFVDLTRKVEQATKDCDFKLAANLINQVNGLVPREQFIADWISSNGARLVDLQNREQQALTLINNALSLANHAAVSAGAPRADWNAIATGLQNAAKTLAEAENVAPTCVRDREKARIEEVRRLILETQRRRPPRIETSIVLVIDTSGSMSGDKINQAKRAARASVSKVTQSTEMAIMHFGGGCDQAAVRLVAGFSTNAAALTQAIDALGAGGGTPMYIATALAVQYAERRMREVGSHQGLVVLLSDGADTCQNERIQASDVVRSSNIPVNTIGFDIGGSTQAQRDLENLASMSRGRSYSAGATDPREIIRAFNLALLPSLLKDWDARLAGSGAAVVQTHFTQAKALLQRQDVAGALTQFEQAYKLAAASPAVNYNLSLMYEAQDQLSAAIRHAENYMKLSPDSPDCAEVQTRIDNLQDELRRNPRGQFDPAACRDIYVWAQAEQEIAKRSKDIGRRQAVLEILITAQRGECEKARQLQGGYKQRYR